MADAARRADGAQPGPGAATASMRIGHVITELGSGGAAAMLHKLVSATQGDGVVHAVASLTSEGVVGPRLAAQGVRVACLGMSPGRPRPLALVRLVRWLRRERIDVVQSWMYHADLLAGLAGALARVPVVWGIHHSDVDPRHVKRLTGWTRALCARLSPVLPARIVCCARSALESHRAIGYRGDRMVVIPNGFDVDRLAPDPQARAQVRRDLSIPDGAPAIGLLARFHPDKDHQTFLAAAGLVAARRPDAVFVLAGIDVEAGNPVLAARIDELGLRSRVRLLGPRRDVPRLLAALDVLVSASRSEAFPLVLGEAMLCGTPCVATDCGDSREIVGPTGRVVPPRTPAALADGVAALLALAPGERKALGAAARERIRGRYDMREVADRYLALYREVRRREQGRGR